MSVILVAKAWANIVARFQQLLSDMAPLFQGVLAWRKNMKNINQKKKLHKKNPIFCFILLTICNWLNSPIYSVSKSRRDTLISTQVQQQQQQQAYTLPFLYMIEGRDPGCQTLVSVSEPVLCRRCQTLSSVFPELDTEALNEWKSADLRSPGYHSPCSLKNTQHMINFGLCPKREGGGL